MNALQPVLDTVGGILTYLVTTRVRLPLSHLLPLVTPHWTETRRNALHSATTAALNVPLTPDGSDPTFALFWVLHSSIQTMWFHGTKEKTDGKGARSALGAWVQVGFAILNMTGNTIAGLLTGRPPLMLNSPDMMVSYTIPYLVISLLAAGGLNLPQMIMENPVVKQVWMALLMITNGIATTMVISSLLDLILSDPQLSLTVGRSLPGQYTLTYLSAIGGALALEGVGLLKLDWNIGLPNGVREIMGPGSLPFRLFALTTALYMIMVNPHLASIVRILFNLPLEAAEKPTALIPAYTARTIILCINVSTLLWANVVGPMLQGNGEKRKAGPVKKAVPSTPKMGREGTPARRN